MQDNKAGTNNPINPLAKVAALTIRRDENRLKKKHNELTIPVIATLNFQKSVHLQGQAKDNEATPAEALQDVLDQTLEYLNAYDRERLKGRDHQEAAETAEAQTRPRAWGHPVDLDAE